MGTSLIAAKAPIVTHPHVVCSDGGAVMSGSSALSPATQLPSAAGSEPQVSPCRLHDSTTPVLSIDTSFILKDRWEQSGSVPVRYWYTA